MGMDKFQIRQDTDGRKLLSGHTPSDPKTRSSGHLKGGACRGQRGMKTEQVMERVSDRRRLQTAWQQVRKNAGAAGIDKVTIEAFEKQADRYLSLAHEKLQAGTYRFKPSRRVLIPKPGTSKKRILGIPTVLDRVVSQSVNLTLEEIFSSDFTRSNFGFRRGKSQHQAISHAKQIILEGYRWCASIDLQSFFDEIPHGLILKLIRRKIRDERLVTLVARALKAGVIVDGNFTKTDKGCPQGSPLSPILSNIALNELDHELERRGHRYVRWADDFLVFVKSKRAATRVMEGTTCYLEDELKLPVNKEKSKIAPYQQVVFLSFQMLTGKIRISTKAKTKLKQKIRDLTKRNNPLSMYEVIQALNEYLKGWISYYRIQEFRQIFGELDQFIRNRLRSMQLRKWKTPKKFQRVMIRAGRRLDQARQTWVNMRKWQSVHRREVKYTLNLQWFRKQGLVFLDDFTHRNLEFDFTG
jgi:RNA-directed DNA polymerase